MIGLTTYRHWLSKKSTLKSAIEGKKNDYIVLYLNGISHTITDGINEYQ